MLQTLLACTGGIDNRWLVIDGGGFFAVTKRMHKLLHGDRVVVVGSAPTSGR